MPAEPNPDADSSSAVDAQLHAVIALGPEAIKAALAAGADPNARDSDDWSPLDRAAGGGYTEAARLLLEYGADPTARGREQRTAYQIALAAGHLKTARVLRDAEERADPESANQHVWRPYCRAYLLAGLRRFAGWHELPHDGDALTDDSVVYLHDDGTVTRSMWPGEDVVFATPSAEWVAFYQEELCFRIPDDFDLAQESPRQA
jgi:ankyrin repeat protein